MWRVIMVIVGEIERRPDGVIDFPVDGSGVHGAEGGSSLLVLIMEEMIDVPCQKS